MAHYAYLDENNIVTMVIVGKNEGEDGVDWEEYYGAKRTSYNTLGGVHYNSETGEPSSDQSKAFRKNYAGIGYTYDSVRDAFVPPKHFPSWILNEDSCLWEAPIPKPQDGKQYDWFERGQKWVEIDY
jgi:hypothetical protein